MDELGLMEELVNDFNALVSELEQWEWFIDQHQNGTIPMRLYLDNDTTSIEFYQSENMELLVFDAYIGRSEGICCLLTALNIDFEVA